MRNAIIAFDHILHQPYFGAGNAFGNGSRAAVIYNSIGDQRCAAPGNGYLAIRGHSGYTGITACPAATARTIG